MILLYRMCRLFCVRETDIKIAFIASVIHKKILKGDKNDQEI